MRLMIAEHYYFLGRDQGLLHNYHQNIDDEVDDSSLQEEGFDQELALHLFPTLAILVQKY